MISVKRTILKEDEDLIFDQDDLNHAHEGDTRRDKDTEGHTADSLAVPSQFCGAGFKDSNDWTVAQDFAARALQKAYREWREIRIQNSKGWLHRRPEVRVS